jgi:hypothetical protein
VILSGFSRAPINAGHESVQSGQRNSVLRGVSLLLRLYYHTGLQRICTDLTSVVAHVAGSADPDSQTN